MLDLAWEVAGEAEELAVGSAWVGPCKAKRPSLAGEPPCCWACGETRWEATWLATAGTREGGVGWVGRHITKQTNKWDATWTRGVGGNGGRGGVSGGGYGEHGG